MEQSNNLLNEKLDAKYVDINIASIPYWSKLCIDKIYPEFEEEFHKFIIDYVPHADKYQPKEEPTHTPQMFDLYIYMKIGLPRGLVGELYYAKVKRCSVDRYRIPVRVETSNPITDTRLYDLEILAADAKNAFLTFPCREKVWTRAGPEFGIREGKSTYNQAITLWY